MACPSGHMTTNGLPVGGSTQLPAGGQPRFTGLTTGAPVNGPGTAAGMASYQGKHPADLAR